MKLPPLLKPLVIAIITGVLVSSCVSREEIVYLHNLEEKEALKGNNEVPEAIKPKDLLTISVAAPEQVAALPFNLPVVGAPMSGIDMSMNVNGRQQMQTYLVSSEGKIKFPQLGEVEVEGLSREEVAKKLEGVLTGFIKDPLVTVRIVNFEISVLGEVNRPGTFDVEDGFVSLPQALGMAGDMSIYGRRDNVLVVREENGEKTHAYLDLTDTSVTESPYYYLKQNDVVYVEPNGPQRQSASYNRNASVYISIASVLVSLAVLITR